MSDRNDNPATQDEADLIIRLLLSRRPAAWAEAEGLLATHTSALPAVAHRATELARVRHRRGRWMDWGSLAGAAILVGAGLLHAPPLAIIALAALVGVTGTGLAVLSRKAIQEAWLTRLDRFVGALENAGAVGPLAEVLAEGDDDAQRAAARCLIRLLPAAAYRSDLVLTDRQRRCLYGAFDRQDLSSEFGPPSPLTVFPWHEYHAAALQFARQIEDTSAIPDLERYVDRLLPGAYRRHVNACVIHLREVAAREQATVALLRPADAPAGDALLRPAAAEAETPKERLLRPIDGALE